MYNYYNDNHDLNSESYTQENIDRFYENYKTAKAPAAKKKGTGRVAALALCFSLLGGALGTGGTYLALRSSDSPTTSITASAEKTESEKDNQTVMQTTDRNEKSEEKSEKSEKSDAVVANTASVNSTKLTAAEVYKKNVNSTVGITTSINTNYFGYKTTAAASGSGFIISADGYIVTNHHVIEDANKITVTLYNGKTYDAELVGSNEANDIAVLKIDAEGLTPVTIGSSTALSVGDEVVAIGNPLGELTFSLTAGVVSALDRTITTENATMKLIQTDAAINAGNSGGALFNMYGEVVGITNAKYSSSGSATQASIDNIGFAIPMDNVKSMIESIIDKGYAVTPYIGVSVTNSKSSQQQDSDTPAGALIKVVNDDSPAQSAGLKVDDIVTEVNGKQVASSSEFIAQIKSSKKGDKLVCKVYRDGDYTEVTVTVDEKKEDSSEKSDSEEMQKSFGQQGQGRNGYGNYDNYGSYDNYGGFGGLEDFFN